jgi:hypothetical protein
MRISRFKIIFLLSVLMFCAKASEAKESGFSDLNIRSLGLTISKSTDLASINATCRKAFGITSNSFSIHEIRNSGAELLLHAETELTEKNDDSKSNNILGMYILLGTGKLRYNVEGSNLYNFDYAVIKGGGVSLEIPLLSLNERFSIYNELGFSVFKAQTSQHIPDTSGGDPANNYYDVNLTFSPNAVTLSNTVRYTLTPGEFRYYLAIGVYNSFVVSATNQKETVHFRNGESVTYTEHAVPDPSVYGLMLLACSGFSYKSIGFELRFDPGHNYSNKLNYAVYMPSFEALLQVRFNPK